MKRLALLVLFVALVGCAPAYGPVPADVNPATGAAYGTLPLPPARCP